VFEVVINGKTVIWEEEDKVPQGLIVGGVVIPIVRPWRQ
jgi:hypothetical protein